MSSYRTVQTALFL